MNTSTWARDHFLQNSWRSFFSVFTLGLFFDLDFADAGKAALYSFMFLAGLSLFYHSAIRVQLPWLDRILVTPQVHRIHHSIDAVHHNRNFADALPVFDIIFGTYHRPEREEFPPPAWVRSTERRAPSGRHSWGRCAMLPLFFSANEAKTNRKKSCARSQMVLELPQIRLREAVVPARWSSSKIDQTSPRPTGNSDSSMAPSLLRNCARVGLWLSNVHKPNAGVHHAGRGGRQRE